MPDTPRARVSVALGTHNGARYLREQLESILGQSRPVDEIVLSDDASGDGTVELAEQVLAEHRSTDAATPTLVNPQRAALIPHRFLPAHPRTHPRVREWTPYVRTHHLRPGARAGPTAAPGTRTTSTWRPLRPGRPPPRYDRKGRIARYARAATAGASSW